MRLIGLTGGIASGKTMITDYLRSLGAVVIDADEVSRELTKAGNPVLDEIAEAFGEDCLDESGNLRRRELGRVIFNDEAARKRLNDITHPKIEAVVKDLIKKYEDAGEKAIIYSAPLLLERGDSIEVDEIWVVALNPDAQISRMLARDGLDRDEAMKKLSAQSGLEEKLRRADKVIDNNGSPGESKRQAKALWERALGN